MANGFAIQVRQLLSPQATEGIHSDQSHHRDLLVNNLANVQVLTTLYIHGERCTYLNMFCTYLNIFVAVRK